MTKINLNTVKRECGDCRACCYSIGVAEINKDQWVNCAHECESGCGIFGQPERPPTCGQWSCAWLLGIVPEEYKPNRCGLVISPVPSDASIAKMPHFYVVENFDGANQSELSKSLIQILSEKYIVVLRFFKQDKIKLLGPSNLLEVFKKNVEING